MANAAEESSAKQPSLENVINALLETNARLDRISVNTELTAESVIEAIPVKETVAAEAKTRRDVEYIQKDVSNILIAICTDIAKNIELIADRSKFIMEDIAAIWQMTTETVAVKPLPEKATRGGKKGLNIVPAAEAYAQVAGQGKAAKAGKKAKPKGKAETIKKDPFEDLGLTGQIVSLMIDIGKEMYLITKGFADAVTSGISKLMNSELGKKIKGFFKGIGGFIGAALDEARDALKSIIDSEFGQKFLKPIGNFLATMGKKILKGISWISGKIGDMFKRLTPGLAKVGSALLQKMPGVKKVVDLGAATFRKIFGEKEEAGKKGKADKAAKKGAPLKKEEKKKSILEKGTDMIVSAAKGFAKFTKGLADVIKVVMVSLAEGIKAFGDTKVLKGAAALVIAAGALVLTTFGLKQFADIEWESIAKGAVTLLGLAGTVSLIGKIKGDVIAGALGMAIAAGSLWITAKALQEFASVDWETIGKAAVSLLAVGALIAGAGALAELIIPGALAIAAAGGALWVAAKGFQEFGNLDWESIGKGLTAALGIGALGAIMGVASPFIIAGAAALGAMGIALGAVGVAMQLVGPAMESMVKQLKELAAIGGNSLLELAGGLTALGAAFVAFAGGSVVAGIGNLVTKFLSFGGDTPIEQLIKLGANGEGVTKAAVGLAKISEAMKQMSQIPKDAMSAVNDFPWIKATAFVAAGGKMETSEVRVMKAKDAGGPLTGAEMSLYQRDTAQMNAAASQQVVAIPAGGGSTAAVNNSNVNSVTYNNTALPDRTQQYLTPAFGY